MKNKQSKYAASKYNVSGLCLGAIAIALFITGEISYSVGDDCVVCYDASTNQGFGFCTTPSGIECGNNVVVSGHIVASGYKTVNGCGNFWGNPLHHDCSGLAVGACQ